MADEVKQLERELSVARKELKNIRNDMVSMKKMFVQKFKDLQRMLENDQYQCVTKERNQVKCAFTKQPHVTGSEKSASAPNPHYMQPIGYAESCFKEKNGIPRQPSVCPGSRAKLSVSFDGFTNPEHSLEGLANFSHVWIVFVFHKNTNKTIKAKVKPPRLDGAKVGVFASRSPHRPNPIGLTLARLDAIIGNTLLLSGIDLLDGTPVLDIKPYVPDYDKPLANDATENTKRGQTESHLFQEKDFIRSQANSTCRQMCLVDDQGTESSPEPSRTLPNVAEWIRKPPIKELSVKFTTDAEAQITCFHGKVKLRGFSLSGGENGHASPLNSGRKCACFDAVKESVDGVIPSMEAGKSIFELGDHRGKSERSRQACEEIDSVSGSTECKTLSTVRGGGLTEGFQISDKNCEPLLDNELLQGSSVSAFASESKSTEATNHHKCEDLQKERSRECLDPAHREKISLREFEPVVNISNSDNIETLQSISRKDIPCFFSADTCIFQLEMLSSPEEARQAIADILRADPRSVYRRNRCQGQLYHFSIDKMNVTCEFDDATVLVLRVDPVFHREYNVEQTQKLD